MKWITELHDYYFMVLSGPNTVYTQVLQRIGIIRFFPGLLAFMNVPLFFGGPDPTYSIECLSLTHLVTWNVTNQPVTKFSPHRIGTTGSIRVC
jgi:hypothetical protein